MATADFGKFVLAVQERDVELLLLEEFHVNEDFSRWLCKLLGLTDARFDGAWHSVSDTDGETDLLVRVVQEQQGWASSLRTRLLHPNKASKRSVTTYEVFETVRPGGSTPM